MGKMKELWMDEMERLEDLYRAEQLLGVRNAEAISGSVEAPQEERRDETQVEVAQGQEDQALGQ